MTPYIRLNGADLAPDRSGALFWPARSTLIVADLHFEKGSAAAERTGRLAPPYDTSATLTELERAVDRLAPDRVICLGDSFHDLSASDRLSEGDRMRIGALADGRDWIWILGNHDPAPPRDLGGTALEEFVDGPIIFRHEARLREPVSGEISGHYHPKALVRTRARRVQSRCFAADESRLVMPAFGAFTGGLNVLDEDLFGLFRRFPDVWVLGRRAVHRVPRHRLASSGAGG